MNEHVTFWRLNRNRREVPHHLLPERADQDDADAVDVVWRALSGLPRRQQAVLALRFYEDLSDAQIGALLGIGESTVRSHAARGLASLRTVLGAGPIHVVRIAEEP